MNFSFKTITLALLLCLSAYQSTAQNEALKILPNGNVGIGTTNPTTTLEVNGTVKANSFIGNGALVKGIIVMWYGDINAVPATWALCDGQNGTPDLRNRFVVGAGQNYARGDTGGQGSVKLTISEVPSHVHTGNTNNAGNHYHKIEGTRADGLDYRKRQIPGVTTVWMDFGGNHNSDPGGEGWRGFVRTDDKGDHSHSFTTAATGGNASHENRPPYLALAYIMKL